jgi:hypothetical protein
MSRIALNANASGSGVFTIESPNSDTDRTLNLPDKAGTVQVGEGIDDNATSTALTITSGEYVGLGNADPVTPFDVTARSGAFAMAMRARSNNDYAFFGMRSYDGTEDLGDIAILRTAADTGRMLFYTNNGGSATVKMSILPSGGITFNGDTAAANALDDYEEGTWTPAFTQGFSSVSYHATHLSGTYTKVGNQVNCWFYIYLNTSTGNGADIKIGGLPYNQRPNVSSGTVINIRSIGNSGYNTLISGKHLQFYGEPSTNYFYLYSDGSTAASVSGGSPSGTFLIGSLSYQAS